MNDNKKNCRWSRHDFKWICLHKKTEYHSSSKLEWSKSASVLSLDGDVLETTMDDIEFSIILDYYKRDCKYIEEIV